MQRASRTRLAVALSMAGLVVGTLGGNLVGAGANNPLPPVPGEAVVGSPTQVDAHSAGGVSDPTATTETTPDAPAEATASTTTSTTSADETPAPADPQVPAGATPPAGAPATSAGQPATAPTDAERS